ncbi:4-hydroxythreonine-4-phosphate dehydrogenase PdxA [Streptomyces sp. NPDC051684]|uniref:4-hydroxythreonine-4-phosphate dehydrogenase PdxA n=1 Tax=Streptomyces sp. NPDC051684 TaxID=3365670 RepID=UPI00379AC8F7
MSKRDPELPRVAVTFGDPAGIGPELVARLLDDPKTRESADLVLLADEEELRSAGEDAGLDLGWARGLLHAGPAPERPAGGFQRKAATAEGGRWALGHLKTGLDLARAGEVDAILFAPLNKSSLHLAGMTASDELRWFEAELGVDSFTSELNAVPGLWTARVTSHVSLADVAAGITYERVTAAGRLLDRVLRGAGVEAPRIGVCALNPHAGENGHFGRHELDIITPAIDGLREAGLDLSGPFPSDTIFGVTIAGGLPIPICTPAHGTAFDLVGRGAANTGSVRNAFEPAVRLARR